MAKRKAKASRRSSSSKKDAGREQTFLLWFAVSLFVLSIVLMLSK